MPLTAKGEKVLAAFRREYGETAGTSHFYASRNAGKITGVDAKDMSGENWSELERLFGEWIKEERAEPEHAADSQMVDFGPKSSRKYDPQNGFLHVRCHISKACVNPYRGSEIPGWEGLGLDADRIYHLFRDPAELEKAAPSFHNLPLMSGESGKGGGHPAGGVTSGDEHLIKIGSIANPSFEHPYLDADLVVWNDTPIAGIETDTVRELSSSYGYVPVMEPGRYQDVDYDGRMTTIHGNHVALVEAGRAGSDVIVGDAALDLLEPGDFLMPLKPRVSARSVLARGAIVTAVRPLLASDAKLDMAPISAVLGTVTDKNWSKVKPRLATAIIGALGKIKLACDAEEAKEKVHEALDGLDEEAEDGELEEETGAQDEAETEEERKDRMERRAEDRKAGRDCAADEDDETEEEREHRKEARDRRAKDRRMAKDAEESEREKAEKEHKAEDRKAWDARMKARDARKGMDRKAMDQAIREAESRTEQRVIARLNSIAEAKAEVLPYVGEFSGAADSAEEIYRFALDQAGVDHAGIREVAALRQMVRMLPKPGQEPRPLASDAAHHQRSGAASDDWLKSFGVRV